MISSRIHAASGRLATDVGAVDPEPGTPSAALYEYAILNDTAQTADSQLSVWYGHVPFLHGGTATMDRSYWAYVQSHPAQ